MQKKIYITSLILMLIDLLTKYLVSNYLTFKEIIPDFFNIYLTHNNGAAFSILKNSQIILIIISIFVLFYIIKYMIPKVTSNMEYISISMIIGGTLGNLFDRIYNNYVIDFISLNIFGYNFPVFNFADILITCGAIFLIIILIGSDKSANNIRKK